MSKHVPILADYIGLGEALTQVRNPQTTYIVQYRESITNFVKWLDLCGLPRTRIAARPLEQFHIEVQPSGAISPSSRESLQAMMRSIEETLYSEAGEKGIIFADSNVPESILNLHVRFGELADYQHALQRDVITCLRASAYRPAIVVAWALGFDLVRSWIFADPDRLSEFNDVLRQRTQHRGPREIVDYADFFRENESFVLQICRDAPGPLQLFTNRTYRQLENLLDDRNAFAHANFDNATADEARAYIDRMLRVLSNAPF